VILDFLLGTESADNSIRFKTIKTGTARFLSEIPTDTRLVNPADGVLGHEAVRPSFAASGPARFENYKL
jgi:hypothetical protein